MEKRTSLIALGLLFALVSSCGDEDEELTGKAACERMCERMEDADCRRQDAACERHCVEDHENTPRACRKELDAFSSCFARAEFECNAQGLAEAQGCKRELEAWLECWSDEEPSPREDDSDDDVDEGDLPADGGTDDDWSDIGLACWPGNDCQTCAGESCCGLLEACTGACQETMECVDSCSDSGCEQDCYEVNPKGAAAYQALNSCLAKSCADECGASDGGPDDDTPPQDSGDISKLCLDIPVPDGYCDNLGAKSIGHDCPNGKPYSDCVLSPTGAANVYCCSK